MNKNPRYYHLPISSETATSWSYLEKSGGLRKNTLSYNEIKLSLKKAQSADYDAISIPCNFVAEKHFADFMQEIRRHQFKVVFEAHQSFSLLQWQTLEKWFEVGDCINVIVEHPLTFEQTKLIEDHLCRHEEWHSTFVIDQHSEQYSTLSSMPQKMQHRLYFYFVLQSDPEAFPCQEVHRIIKKFRNNFPFLAIRPPKGIDVYDPRIEESRSLEPMNSICYERKVESAKTVTTEIPASEANTINSSIKVSIVIPTYNNIVYISNVVRHLSQLNFAASQYEVIVVDDGSTDQTRTRLPKFVKELPDSFNFKLVHFPRSGGRTMGDGQFRAGVARNLGVKHASGEILLFLDSDILLPKDYLTDLVELHKSYDLVQGRRVELTEEKSSGETLYEEVDEHRDTYIVDRGYWYYFYTSDKAWEEHTAPWRYVCTHSLSVKKRHFKELGWFRKAFTFYGFEDTELGFRFFAKNFKCTLSNHKVYHLFHANTRSEFKNSHYQKRLLLAKSANTFYLNTLDEEVFEQCHWLFRDNLKFKLMIDDIIKMPIPWYLWNRMINKYILRHSWGAPFSKVFWAIKWTLSIIIMGISKAIRLFFSVAAFPFRKTYFFCRYQYFKRFKKIDLLEDHPQPIAPIGQRLPNPKASIIIPTHNRPQQLRRLLESIAEQNFDLQSLEVIVVSNLDSPRERQSLAGLKEKIPGLIYMSSQKIGVNRARNLGLNYSSGRILIFLDDDCRLIDKNYIQMMINAHRGRPDAIGIGGSYKLPPRSGWASSLYNQIAMSWLRCCSDESGNTTALLGGNASYKKALRKSDYRYLDSIIWGGSETSLNNQLIAGGERLHFHPEIQVEHDCKIGFFKLLKKAFWQGFNEYGLQLAASGGKSYRASGSLALWCFDQFYNYGGYYAKFCSSNDRLRHYNLISDFAQKIFESVLLYGVMPIYYRIELAVLKVYGRSKGKWLYWYRRVLRDLLYHRTRILILETLSRLRLGFHRISRLCVDFFRTLIRAWSYVAHKIYVFFDYFAVRIKYLKKVDNRERFIFLLSGLPFGKSLKRAFFFIEFQIGQRFIRPIKTLFGKRSSSKANSSSR